MNSKQPITIAGNVYQIGFSFRAIKLFEELTGKSTQEISGSWDNLIFAYCSLKALNPEFTLTVDQFVDILDENPQLLIELSFGTQQAEPSPEREAVEGQKKKFLTLRTFFALWMLSLLLWVAPVLIPFIFGTAWIFGSLKALYRIIAKPGNKPA